ncbi:MAG: PP2C family protein-serine/threonine phosphatase, partial [Acidimicrobiia bacterium]
RTYTEADLAFAEEIARRAALALDNARLHQEVLRQRSRYEELVNSLGAVVWEATPGSSHYDFVSDPAERMLGYPLERWLYEEGFFWRMLHPDDRDRVQRAERTVVESGNSHVAEYRLIDVDGKVHWVRDQLSVERDERGEAVLLRGVMVDMTEQHEREEALREFARTLQASLLPPQEPSVPGLDVAARYRPAERVAGTVGGDFYDLFPLGEGITGAVIGDVCGKGIEAASLTALARYTLRSAATHAADPAAILAEVNHILLNESSLAERFATVILAIIDASVRPAIATFGVAGHVRPLVLRESGQVEVLRAEGLPLGLFEDAYYESSTATLSRSDTLVLVTDGVTEARNSVGDFFGEERVRGVLEGVAGEPAAVIADRLVERVRAFAGEPLRDDAAILVVRIPA